ncbi:hypothetical protein L5I01_17505 [Gordonia sp. HY442]|uniref:hypothetical protein n=1 Tax=Gordonia zhenghanii TaxID=2911516 RepID=UPI001F15F931|nr:hypothetical protein [Gordonia zhenghanii]MCF8605154.1 hypothetical protein [Gordonia zhenghanii]
MTDIDLDQILAKRAESRGDEGNTFSFSFKGTEWTARDPQMLSDEEKDELADIGDNDIDVAEWFLGGPDKYDAFIAAGGSSSLFFQAMKAYNDKLTDEASGKPTRPNRSARRSAASSKRKAR